MFTFAFNETLLHSFCIWLLHANFLYPQIQFTVIKPIFSVNLFFHIFSIQEFIICFDILSLCTLYHILSILLYFRRHVPFNMYCISSFIIILHFFSSFVWSYFFLISSCEYSKIIHLLWRHFPFLCLVAGGDSCSSFINI